MKTTLLSIATLLAATLGAIAEEAPKKEDAMVTTLLDATQNNDLEKFKSVCDEAMKAAMTEDILAEVSQQISALMEEGYEKVYMGALNRGALKVYYWKIVFTDKEVPDLLVELTIQNGETAGFFIR